MSTQQNTYNIKKFNIGYIYKIQNKINGKVYIGQTIHPDSRPYFHLENPNSTNKRFGSAIKHHGKENFQVSILCECYSKSDLDWAEIFYITEWYDCTHNSRGYNLKKELQGTHYLHSATKEEYDIYRAKMKISQNKTGLNKRRGESIRKTKQSEYWKENRKPSIAFPNYSKHMSFVIKKSRANPEVRKKLSDSQRKSYLENPERRETQRRNSTGRFSKLSNESQELIRSTSRENLKNTLSNPETKEKAMQNSIRTRTSEEGRKKHRDSHNTESCKKKIREAQIHPIRKFVEEHYFVIRDKFPTEFDLYNLCRRFCFDYSDCSTRQALISGFGVLSRFGIIKKIGFYSFSSRGRCNKYSWLY